MDGGTVLYLAVRLHPGSDWSHAKRGTHLDAHIRSSDDDPVPVLHIHQFISVFYGCFDQPIHSLDWRSIMKPEKLFNLIAGITLLIIGVAALFGNLFLATKAWRLWPLIIILAGLGLTLPGFLGFAHRGFGAFFIPGIPVLTSGAILLFASLTDHWEIWAVAWVLEILGLALGFILAAIFMRVPGLAIPAFIIGINGMMLAF